MKEKHNYVNETDPKGGQDGFYTEKVYMKLLMQE